MNTNDLFALLRVHYDEKNFALFREVANATGAFAGRKADAVGMNLWPSRGLTLSGFELKVSRSDWLREKENPAKAEAVCAYMDYWWIVADKGVVNDHELPPSWGLWVAEGGGHLKMKVNAPKLEPKPIDRKFLAAILRAAQKATTLPGDEALTKAREEGFKDGREHAKVDMPHFVRTVRAFEEASGVKINEWSEWETENQAKLLALAKQGLTVSVLVDDLERIGERVGKTLKLLRGADRG